MIEYIEVRNAQREIIGIIDTAKSIIWHSIYYGVGDFEIYINANDRNIQLLAEGNFITRNNDDEAGLIENIQVKWNEQNGLMIAATGRFAKSILDRRVIYKMNGTSVKPSILSGNVEQAARKLVNENAINCPFDATRNIDILELGELANIPEVIIDENGNAAQKQVTASNLLLYTDNFLFEYKMAAKCVLNKITNKFNYIVTKGKDRTTSNQEGNEPVIFSQEFDNLTETEYSMTTANEKNTALIGGEGEGVARFYSLLKKGNTSGLNRREQWIDAQGIKKTYIDEQEVERTYTDAEYRQILNVKGLQDLSKFTKIESFSGKIEINYSQFKINKDFYIGDFITIQDNNLHKYINTQITEIVEVQDENGYSIDVFYQ